MPTPMRRGLRRARRGAGYLVALAVIAMALVLGVASQLLPLVEQNPERIAAWLGARAGRPVAFDGVRTEWTRRGPLLQLDNLRIGSGAQAFAIGDTEMLVSMYAGLLPGHAFSELRLRDVDLTLERAADGRWNVRGLPGQEQAGADPLEALEGLGELQVIGGKLAVIAPSLGIDARIPRVDLRLRVSGERVRAGIRAWPQPGAAPLDAVLDLDRARGDGRAYAGARRADLSAWSPLLRLAGVGAAAGQGRAQAWAQLRDFRIAQVTVEADLEQVALRSVGRSAGLDSGAAEIRQVLFPKVDARVRWQLVDGGWRLDAPRLRIGRDGQAQSLDGMLMAGGERFALLAPRLDATPLLQVAALTDAIPVELRRWLHRAAPEASLSEIEIVGRGDALRARARIDRFGFAPVGDAPGLRGVAGTLQADAAGFVFEPAADSPVTVDWPRGFTAPHRFRLGGRIAGWRDGGGWRVGSSGLRIDGDGVGVDARGSVWWQGDGSRPWLQLAARVDEMQLTRASAFLVRHRMPPRALQWLDAALLGGRLGDGRALVSGDLDDWPFEAGTGTFEASAALREGVIRFHPDWPAVEAVDATLGFSAEGLAVDGSGALAGVPVEALHADIDRYRGGRLRVTASGGQRAESLLALLRDSPLRRSQAETLDSLSASGPASATFGMTLPLRPGATTEIGGQIQLAGARLADPRWKLAFDRVTGRADYSRHGFRAEDLQVRHGGLPARLSLRAGEGHVLQLANAFEAELDATLAASELLERAPQLAWLQPHLRGDSPWRIGVVVPRAQAAARPQRPATLSLASSLVGTRIDLPEPLRKPAGRALATTVQASLPLEAGEVRVEMGELLSLRARTGKGAAGVRVALGGAPALSPAGAGLVVTGAVERMDALEWLAIARGSGPAGNAAAGGGSSGPGGSMPLRLIDVQAEALQVFGGAFADTRLQVAPAPGGASAVRATGPSLQGALLVPAAATAAVAGAFQKVHWTRPATAGREEAQDGAPGGTAAATTRVAAAAPAGGSAGASADAGLKAPVDPARIPPLQLDIADLRVGQAPLGRTTFRSQPTAAGMRVDTLQSRAPGQSVDVSGTWTGRGAAARTRLDATVASADLGALLGGLGLGGRVAGGDGRMQFQATWPGTPADFAMGALEGRLTLEARDGRLLEVEPGAGRVLGLLSLAELPRRLTLDFRDFFSKGFAFNRIGGTVAFADGVARSDDLAIDGPAAAIEIRGSANLRAQRFDQTIEVRPKAGNLLAAVGAIAGGPVGAAIGAAANAVLQKPLGSIAARTYRVTGPWQEPQVEVINRGQARESAPAMAPPG